MLKGRGRLFNLPEGGFVGPVNEAVAAHLRRLILSGAITPRARLPSQRIMAQDFRVSRNTIVAALAQLTSEGLLEARVGAGTYVVASPPRARAYDNEPGARAPARKGALPLEAGMPDVSLFPFELWRKALDLSARGVAQASYLESSGGGWAPLRDLIAARVAAMRGVACSGDQVIVTASSQAAIELAARALAAPGDAAWMEDPGYHRARDALKNAGLAVTPVPVDEDGFDVVEAERRARAKIAYVTACAQMPTGAAMSERRRAALMQ
ncbi:MAG: PLP-dependent aminotransferase family protein, partial [Hyphomonadaceae bacterium]